MKRSTSILRILVAFTFLISILTPMTSMQALAQGTDSGDTAEPAADAPTTGTLQLWVSSSDTEGACFTITDANGGTQFLCDGDLDGLIIVPDLPAGPVSAVQAEPAPAGYLADGSGSGTIVAGQAVDVSALSSFAPVQEPRQEPPADSDGDGVADEIDNCSVTPNGDQADSDGDGIGDACEADSDGDSVIDDADNCVDTANGDQVDTDGDGIGDACDTPDVVEPEADIDADGVADTADNCVNDANADQTDTDGDGIGDACDDNDDNDSHLDSADNCPLVSNKNQNDKDGDGIGDACDDTDDSEAKASIAPASVGGPDPGDISIELTAIGTNGNEVKSLQPFKDLQCDTPITFYDTITVKNGSSTGSSTIEIVNYFAQTTTNGGLVGFLPDSFTSFAITSGNATIVTGYPQITTSGNLTVVTTRISGVDYGETIRFQIQAEPRCRNTSAVGGTIQVNVPSASVISGGTPGSINVGNQTIPLSAQNIVQPIIDVTKTCPVTQTGPAGTVIQYGVTITNAGNVALTGLTFTESRTGTFTPAFPTSLNSGATYTGTFNYTVQPGDTNANNSLTVTGNYSEGTASGSVSDTSAVNCPFTVTTPQIAIFKTADAATVAAGSQIGFTITVRNTGNAATPGTVSFTDPLPSGSGITWTDNSASCTITAGTMTCTFGPLAANNNAAGGPDEFSVRVTSPTTTGSCGVYNNTATLSSPYTGSASATITVVCPDVAVTKLANGLDAATVNVGETITYSIQIANNSAIAPATGVTVSDTLPTGITWSESSDPGNYCSIAGGVLSCTIPTLAAGGSYTVQVTGTATLARCGTFDNTATVAAAGDTNPNNNGSTASVTVLCADVSVSKTTDTPTIGAGQLGRYTITLNVTGTGTAKNVTLTDTLPANFSLVSATQNGTTDVSGACSGAVSCSFGDLPTGTTIVLVAEGTPTVAQCGPLPNTATVSATNDTTSDNNTSRATITVTCPDVAITKVASSSTVSAGDPVTFTITVTNLSTTATATNVSISDTLPAGITWSESGGDPSNRCSITGGVLSCTIPTLAPGASYSVQVTGTTSPANCAGLSNTATVTAAGDTNTQNNTAMATVTVNCPDVTVSKTTATPIVNAGDAVSFQIVVTNLGPGTASGVTLSDTLPAGVSWSEDSASCSITGGVLSCSFGALAKDETRTVNVTGTSSPANCGTLDNTATVAATNEATAQQGNNSDGASITVNCPDVTVTKTTRTPIVNAGDPVSFTITVSNVGEGTASNVTVTDQLPAGVAWSINPAVQGCAITAGTLNCSFPTLAAGASVTIIVTGTTDAADCGTLNNTVTVAASNEGADDAVNNSAQSSITVRCPDVTVTKTGNADSVNAGDPISFEIVVRNIGTGTAYGVTLTDTLPAGFTWTENSASCSIAGGVLSCNFGDLAPQGTASVTISAETTFEDCAVVTNTATVAATNEASTATGNNQSTDEIDINCSALNVVKEFNAASVNAGDPLSFTITVTNNGDGAANNVVLTDPLPAGFAWSESNADCAIAAGTLTCQIGTLASGASFSVTVTSPTTPANCGTINNTATVTSSNAPTATGSDSVVINCPDVTVTKTAGAATVNAGDPVSFTIEVENLGPGAASGVTLTDTLPAGVTWTENSADCSITGGVLSCSFGTLAADATRTVTVSGTSDAADCGVLNNTATVAATNEATAQQGNNSDSASITVNCPDVTVTKVPTNNQGTVNAGDPISFTITVRNVGVGTAYGVTLVDLLPAGFTWTENSAACSITGTTLNCSFGNLAPQASVSVTVSAPTTFENCGVVRNTASVAAANEASTATGNNQSTATISINCSELEVTKTPDQPSVSAGTAIGYTITVTNNGDGAAINVVLTDPLPANAGLSWTISPAVQGCSITAGTLTCQIGTLASGASFSVHVTSPTTAASCATINNLATVTAGNAPEATGSGTITVLCPNVVITKVANAEVVNAGDPISFVIQVTNLGPGVATGVTVSDTLPAGIIWSENSASCSIASGVLSCTFGTLAAGASSSVTLSGTAPAAVCGTVTNTASVSATNEPTSATGDNTASDSVIVNCPDIEVTKTTDTGTVNAGDDVRFTITVENLGPGAATSVVLTDALPGGVAWTIDPQVQGCSITGGTLTCNLGTMAAGASVEVTVVGTTDATDCGLLNNTASATATNEASDDLGNNSDSATIVVECPSVSITKSASADRINAGDPISFTITVTNAGPGDAYDVVVTDDLPAGIAWSETSADCAISNGTLTCDFGTIPASESRSVTVSGTAPPAVCGTITNTATVTLSNEPDLRTAVVDTNTASATVIVDCPDLVLEKTAATSPISAGETASFTITVENLGPGTAYDVVVTDTLPAGVTWTETSTACSITGGVLTCDFGDLADGATASVTVSGVTDATDCGVLNNTATARASNEAATDLGNNTDSASIIVNCPDLEIEKTAEAATISAGDTARFTITVTNLGPGTAFDVAVTDTLPAGVTWTETSADCAITGGVLSCDFGDLIAGATASVTVSGVTDAADCSVLTNTASATASNEASDDRTNNSDTATITVECPDVEIEKTADQSPILTGGTASFTITVTNLGPGTAYDVVVTDTLPTGIVWTDDSEECAIAAGVLTCTIDELADGGTFDVTVSGTVPGNICGLITNTASVTAGNEPDDLRENNSDTATIFVECPGIAVTKSCPVLQTGLKIGDSIVYAVTIRNNGNVPLTGIEVTESRTGDFSPALPTTLAVGEVYEGTFTTQVTAADAAAGEIANRIMVETDQGSSDSAEGNCPLIPGTVIITKTGNEGAEPLPDVCFELRQGESVVIGPVCTDEEGIATFTNVPLGTYIVAEASTPPGYIPAEPFEVTVGNNQTVSLTIDNPRGNVGFPVYKLDCQTDPGDVSAADLFADPAYAPDGCVRVAGVAFEVTIDGEPLPAQFVTSADGSFQLSVQVFASVSVTEDLSTATPGYLPREATLTIDNVPAEGVDGLVFVNLAQDGHLRLVKYVCKTEKPRATEFEITDPTGITLAGGKDDRHDKCWLGANVAFTITGGSLTQPLKVTTDRNGAINIGLRAGTYTIVEDATGATAEFTIVPNGTTVIKVTNYKVIEHPTPEPTPTKPAKPTPEPVTDLPNTGAGQGGLDSLGWLTLLLTLGLGGVALASLLAVSLKRQKGTRKRA